MKIVLRLALATAVATASTVLLAGSADATECTPKGCTTSCRITLEDPPRVFDCNS